MEFGYVPFNFSIPQLNRLTNARQVNQDHFLPLRGQVCYLGFLQHQNIAAVETPIKKTHKQQGKKVLSRVQHKFKGNLVLIDLLSKQRLSHKLKRCLRKLQQGVSY